MDPASIAMMVDGTAVAVSTAASPGNCLQVAFQPPSALAYGFRNFCVSAKDILGNSLSAGAGCWSATVIPIVQISPSFFFGPPSIKFDEQNGGGYTLYQSQVPPAVVGDCTQSCSGTSNYTGHGDFSGQASLNVTTAALNFFMQASISSMFNAADPAEHAHVYADFGPGVDILGNVDPNARVHVHFYHALSLNVSGHATGLVGYEVVDTRNIISSSTLAISNPGSAADSGPVEAIASLGITPNGQIKIVTINSTGGNVQAFNDSQGNAGMGLTLFLLAQVEGNVMVPNGGDKQTGLAGNPLPQALRVQVLDGLTAAPQSGVPITFSVLGPGGATSEGAFVTPTSSTTDSTGVAGAVLTLGSSTGTYKVTASCSQCMGNPTLIFNETTASSMTTVTGSISNLGNLSCANTICIGTTTANCSPINADGSYSLSIPTPLSSQAPSDAVLTCELPSVQCPVVSPVPYCGNSALHCGPGVFDPAASVRHINGKPRPHKGTDYVSTDGNPFTIVSPFGGMVVFVGEFRQNDVLCGLYPYNPSAPLPSGQTVDCSQRSGSWGWVVIIESSSTYQVCSNCSNPPVNQYVLLGHLNPNPPTGVPVVHAGDKISAGQAIGWLPFTSGNASSTCPPEVHVEMRLSTIDLLENQDRTKAIPTGSMGDKYKTIDKSRYSYGQIFLNCAKSSNKRCIQTVRNSTFGNGYIINTDQEFGCNAYQNFHLSCP